MNNWTKIPDDKTIEQTAAALTANGMETFVVTSGEDAKNKVLEFVPEGSEVFTMTSKTLDVIGIPQVINESGKYDSIRKKFESMDRQTQSREMQKIGSSPEYAIASVHALTQDGKAIIASNTGSQLAAEVYGANNVIWVIGAQKIVQDIDEGFKRIYEYVLPLESDRFNKTYNMTTGSFVSKLLIINREIKPGRIRTIIVKQVLGF